MRLYLESPQLRVDLERRHEHIEDRIDAPTGVHLVSHETRLEQHPKHEARLLQAHHRSKHSGCPCSAKPNDSGTRSRECKGAFASVQRVSVHVRARVRVRACYLPTVGRTCESTATSAAKSPWRLHVFRALT